MRSVTHSVPSAQALLEEVHRDYEIAAGNCELLRAGTNDTYLLRGGGAVHLVRVYGAGWRSPSEIAFELALLRHLAARGVGVGLPVPGTDGRLIRMVAAPEGARKMVVFTHVESPPLSWGDPAHCRLVGGSAAAIHAAADGFATRHHRTPLDLTELIDGPLLALRPFLSHRPDDWTALRRIARNLRAGVELAAGAGLDWGACHCDLSVRTIRPAEDGRPFAFDFELCGPGWRAFDLAAVHWVATARADPGVWDAFVEGYRQVRPLGERDLAAVPLFYVVRQLWALGLLARNAPEWGAAALNDGYLDRKLATFERWAAASPVRVGDPRR